MLLKVIVGLGLRENEALGIKWEGIDIQAMTYTPWKTKGKESRQLPIPDWLWSELIKIPRGDGPWIFQTFDGKPHRSQLCKKVLQRVCMAMNLGHITQHRLRATFATLHYAEACTTLPEVQSMLGHKNVSTTML